MSFGIATAVRGVVPRSQARPQAPNLVHVVPMQRDDDEGDAGEEEGEYEEEEEEAGEAGEAAQPGGQ